MNSLESMKITNLGMKLYIFRDDRLKKVCIYPPTPLGSSGVMRASICIGSAETTSLNEINLVGPPVPHHGIGLTWGAPRLPTSRNQINLWGSAPLEDSSVVSASAGQPCPTKKNPASPAEKIVIFLRALWGPWSPWGTMWGFWRLLCCAIVVP